MMNMTIQPQAATSQPQAAGSQPQAARNVTIGCRTDGDTAIGNDAEANWWQDGIHDDRIFPCKALENVI